MTGTFTAGTMINGSDEYEHSYLVLTRGGKWLIFHPLYLMLDEDLSYVTFTEFRIFLIFLVY